MPMIYNRAALGPSLQTERNSTKRRNYSKERNIQPNITIIITIDNCAYDLQQKDLGENSSRDALQAQNLKEPPPMQRGKYIKNICSSKIIKMVLIT